MEPIYIRTDNNGTKIFHDWTCPRCGGAGQAQKWLFTGLVCYGCGGTGRRATPKVIKEYTEEYAAKLEAKRIAKAKKEAEKSPEYTPEEIEEQVRKTIEVRYAEFGCGKDGIGYVHDGNTFKVKDQLKAAGGKWIYGAWVCPVEVKGNGIKIHTIDLKGHIGGGSSMWLDDFDMYDAIHP